MTLRGARQRKLSRNAGSIRPSGIRRIADLAAMRAKEGLPVYPFHLGEPDFDTPAPIKNAAIRALERGEVHYTPNAGIPQLREAIASDLRERYDAQIEAGHVIVTVGSCEALSIALVATLEPNDEIVVPTPCWPNYLQIPPLFGAKVVQTPLDVRDGFRIDFDRLAAAVGPKTRAIIVNTPNNPTGAVATREELDALLELARSNGLWLVVDEIYRDITYHSGAYNGILSIAEPDDPLIYVGGFSKSYAMTGWRVGYAVAANEAFDVMLKAHQMLITSSTSFVQWGALQALDESKEVEIMRDIYGSRRVRVLEALKHSGLAYVVPDGAFYVFPRIPEGFRDADEFCEAMLMRHGVALVPGGVFGDAHNQHFRLCFACATDQLQQGLDALVDGVTRKG